MTDQSELPPPPGMKSAKRDEQPPKAAKPRGRSQDRQATEKRARRRRGSVDRLGALKLDVDPDILDLENYEHRWINAGIDGARLHAKTVKDDWDVLSSDGEVMDTKAASDGEGGVIRRAVGVLDGRTEYAYLCRKPRDLYEEDHRARQKYDDKLMATIHEGRAPVDGGLTDHDHVHGEGIRISHKRPNAGGGS